MTNSTQKELLMIAINAYADARVINNETLIQFSINNLNQILEELFKKEEK